MSTTTSIVAICNRALAKVGANRINQLEDRSPEGRACLETYNPIRLAELRAHVWAFAVKRASLPALSTTPVFGRANAFQLPSDFVRLAAPDPEVNYPDLDWKIEGQTIVTDDSAPLEIRYIYDVIDPNLFDALFREALSAALAVELCEKLTQSNTKKQALLQEYALAIREARRIHALERPPRSDALCTWITVRD